MPTYVIYLIVRLCLVFAENKLTVYKSVGRLATRWVDDNSEGRQGVGMKFSRKIKDGS